jgi:hypothetical protein
MNTLTDIKKLLEPFPPEKVEWRIGSTTADKTKGIPLAYITSRDVMDRLDEVVGPENWQNDYPVIGSTTVCRIGIKIRRTGGGELSYMEEWVWKSDGAGVTDVEAEKGQLSDSFKRCAVHWGIGRYLYDIKVGWVDIVPAGRSYKLPDHVLDDLMNRLGAKSAKIVGLPGLAKTPGKFWEGAKLTIALKNEFMTPEVISTGIWSDEAKKWWKGKFSDGLEKAPTEVLLAKYWKDNEHIITTLSTTDQEGLREAYDVRVKQHQQYKG